MSPRPQISVRNRHRLARFAIALVGAYTLVAYLIAPIIWRAYERRHADFSDSPRVTRTGSGIPGDPLNLSLVGADGEVVRALTAAGWYPADPITFRSSVRICVATFFRRPDNQAPVSNLFLFGRKQDLAFEKAVNGSPKQRHHVRLWRTDETDDDRTVWIGAATYDVGVEFSRTTGQVTHHIAPDIDAERDFLIADLEKALCVKALRWVDDFHAQRAGRNGGGDPWRTDGRLAVVTLVEADPKP